MAKLDFSKIKKPEKSYLKEMGEEQDRKAASASSAAKQKTEEPKKKAEKTGRPTIGDEPISKRFSLAFTETEYNTLKENAGKIPLASFIRDILKVAKVI